MFERILEFDEEVFLTINRSLENPVLDALLIPARNPLVWSPVYLFLVVFLLINFRWQGLKVIGLVLLVFILTDQISGQLIKPFFARVRPCNDEYLREYVRMLVPCGSGYSFTSNHASNHFGISFILIPFFRRFWRFSPIVFLLWAATVSFAQVYVGLHYPIDVSAGAILGGLVAWGVYSFLGRKVDLDLA